MTCASQGFCETTMCQTFRLQRCLSVICCSRGRQGAGGHRADQQHPRLWTVVCCPNPCTQMQSASKPYRWQAMPTTRAEVCCLSCSVRIAPPQLQAVKTAGSIHNVSRRLLPNGLYFDAERTIMEEFHGDQLSIENLCETSWSHHNSKWRPAHLKLCPLPLPDGMEEPSDMRLRQVSRCCRCLCTSYQLAVRPAAAAACRAGACYLLQLTSSVRRLPCGSCTRSGSSTCCSQQEAAAFSWVLLQHCCQWQLNATLSDMPACATCTGHHHLPLSCTSCWSESTSMQPDSAQQRIRFACDGQTTCSQLK